MESLLEEARRRHWCVRAHCGEREPVEYRAGLQRINAVPGRLAANLAAVEFVPWYDLPGGHHALELAFQALKAPDEVDLVLSAWLGRLDGHVRLADAVLRFVIRPGLPTSHIADAWTAAAVELAVGLRDASLLTALVQVLGPGLAEDERLMVAARLGRRNSRGLRHALQQAGYSFRNPPESGDDVGAE